MKSDYQSIVTLVSLAFKAGGEIMNLYNQEIKFDLKNDLSPITQADRISDEIIVNGLNKEFSEIQCISEESHSKINIKSYIIWSEFILILIIKKRKYLFL